MSIYDNNKHWKVTNKNSKKHNNSSNNNNGQKFEDHNKRDNFSQVTGKRLTNPRKNNSRSDGRYIEPDVKTGNSVFTRNTADNDPMADVRKTLKNFTSDIIHYKNDVRSIKETIVESFIEVCEIMRNFYNSKYNSVSKEMNDVLDLMSTEFFYTALQSVINSGSLDVYNNRNIIGYTIATLVTTSSDKMHSRTVNDYVYNILNSDDVFGPIVSELVQKAGVTEDCALDLCIAIPMDPSEMNDKDIQQYYGKFLDILLEHSDDNIDILDSVTINKILSFMFGGNTKGSPAIKVIGRLMAEPRIAVDTEPKAEVYKEFIKMLYTRLNDKCDIKDIKFVLNYVLNKMINDTENGENKDLQYVFDENDAADYEEIMKALSLIIEEDEKVSQFFGTINDDDNSNN